MCAVYIHPRTRQRRSYMPMAGDFTLDLTGDDAIAREDVPLTGDWTDWTGSGGALTSTQSWFSSQENSLQGTDAQVDGKAKLPNLSVIGTRIGTHRRRVIKEYVDPSKPNSK